jgi:hypothetical protein
LFVVRAAGDEASASLAAGQFLGWISALLNRRLTNLWFWAVIILMGQASVLAALTHIASPGLAVFIILLYLFVAAGLLAVGVVSVMLAAALPFGWDGPFLSIFASCSAGGGPTGTGHHPAAGALCCSTEQRARALRPIPEQAGHQHDRDAYLRIPAGQGTGGTTWITGGPDTLREPVGSALSYDGH